MRPVSTPLFVGPLAIAIGAMFGFAVIAPARLGWAEGLPLVPAAICAGFGGLAVLAGVHSLWTYVRARAVMANVMAQACGLRLSVDRGSDDTTYRVRAEIAGQTYIRGGRAVSAVFAGRDKRAMHDTVTAAGLAWVAPATDRPVAFAVLTAEGPLVLDTYGIRAWCDASGGQTHENTSHTQSMSSE